MREDTEGQKSVSIVSWYYPPYNTIAAQRPYSWVKYFESKHLFCHVHTADHPGNEVESRYVALHNITLPFTQSLAPDRSQAWQRFFSFIGTMINGSWFLVSALMKLVSKRPEIIITTYGPKIVILVGYFYKIINPDSKWIVDYRDLWTTRSLNTDRGNLYKLLTLNIPFLEKFISKKYDIVTTVSHGLSNDIEILIKRKSHIIYNGYFEADQRVLTSKLKQSNPPSHPSLRIVYTGTLYPSKYYRYDVFFNALTRAATRGIVFDFYGNDTTYDDFLKLKESYKGNSEIRNHGLVSHDKAVSAQEEADYLLFFAWDDGVSDGVLSGKIFEYLASGKPIIAIGCDEHHEITQILRKSGCSYVIHRDAEELARILIEIERIPGLPKWYEPNNNFIKSFSRVAQADKMYQLIR